MAAEPKTRPTRASVKKFLDAIEDPVKRKDARTVCKMMQKVTGERPTMWGEGIVGFGSVPLKYASGRELDWPVTGFSPRKQALTLYFMPGFTGYTALMRKLGKVKTAKSCLYVKKLADVDVKVLEQLVARSVKDVQKKYG